MILFDDSPQAFVAIRNMLSYKNELSQQIKELRQELEARLGEQDTQIIDIYDVLDELMDKKNLKLEEERKKIGYKYNTDHTKKEMNFNIN